MISIHDKVMGISKFCRFNYFLITAFQPKPDIFLNGIMIICAENQINFEKWVLPQPESRSILFGGT